MSDGKELAKSEVKRADTQRLMRQFLKLESGLGNKKSFVENWEKIFKEPTKKLPVPVKCKAPDCPAVAEDLKDIEWHEKTCPGHFFFRKVR